MKRFIFYFWVGILFVSCSNTGDPVLKLNKGSHIVLIGNNLGSRMINYGSFETELHVRYPDSLLYIRNMCDGGETPGFRPHSGRMHPWAFPGAEKYQTELATNSGSEGTFGSPDQWLTTHKADIIIAFFGYNESFGGAAGLENFKAELDSFINYTSHQKYNGQTAPQLAVVSPIAFENLSSLMDLPDGKTENANLLMYTDAMREVATKNGILFIDAYGPSKEWFDNTEESLTIDGAQLNSDGYAKFSKLLADKAFGSSAAKAGNHRDLINAAVMEKKLDVA